MAQGTNNTENRYKLIHSRHFSDIQLATMMIPPRRSKHTPLGGNLSF